jgi:hypothetical protein
VRRFGSLPVLVGGRVMPMDSLARVSLSEWNHHGTYSKADKTVIEPSDGLLEILMMPERADTAKLFEVSDQDILNIFGSPDAHGGFVLFSFSDLKPFFGEIEKQAGLAEQTEPEVRNPFNAGLSNCGKGYAFICGSKTRFRRRIPLISRKRSRHSPALFNPG